MRESTEPLTLLGLALTLLPGMVAAQAAASARRTDFGAVADSVRSVVRTFAATFATREGQDLLPFLRPDSAFRFVFGGQTMTYGQYRDLLLRAPRERWRSVELRWDSLQVTLLAPDVAAVTAVGAGTLIDPSGAVKRFRNAGTMVWTRRADGWKLLTMGNTEGALVAG